MEISLPKAKLVMLITLYRQIRNAKEIFIIY